MKNTKWLFLLLALSIFLPKVTASESINEAANKNVLKELLEKAEVLIANNQSIRAFSLLNPLAETNAGNPQFDYLLGLSALETGKTSIAIFALERSVAIHPNFGGAHFELGRAYYRAHELHQAKRQFEISQSLQPPRELQQFITVSLKKINAKLYEKPINFETYVTLKGGFDDNVNSATENESFLGLILTQESKATPSEFMGLTMNNTATYSSNKRTDIYLSAAIFDNRYNRASFVNSSGAMSSIGMSYKRLKFSTNTNISVTAFYLGTEFNTGIIRSTAQWNYFASPTIRFGTSSTISYYTHASNFSLRDRYQGSIEINTKFSYKLFIPSTALLAGYIEYDAPKLKSSPYEKNSLHTKIITNHFLGGKKQFFTQIKLSTSNYNKPFIGTIRKEKKANFSSGINIIIRKNLSIIPQIKYIKNISTVSLFDYDRFSINLSVQWKIQ